MADFDKMDRVLAIQQRLLEGKALNKQQCAQEFGVTTKSIQRDLDVLRTFFVHQGKDYDLIYDAHRRGYRLVQTNAGTLTNSEIYAVCKILLESRSMVKDEMFPILDKLVRCCTPMESLQQVKELIQNERFHYTEPHHGQKFIDTLWEIGTAVRDHKVMQITYRKTHGGEVKERTVEPVGVLFSEYYFYLAAFIVNKDDDAQIKKAQATYPAIYRIDHIEKFKVTDTLFQIPYKDRYQEGEVRKKIQFMFGGSLHRVQFEYLGPDIEAVLDRLPTATVAERKGEPPIVTAEVFGSGISMWLRSQGGYIKMIDPPTIEELPKQGVAAE